MKRSSVIALALVACGLLQLSSCGLGTEIGNGLKPDDSNDTQDKKKVGASSSQDPAASKADTAPPQVAQNHEGGKTASGVESEATISSDTVGAATFPDAAVSMPPLDLKLLFTSCGTPFATIPRTSLTLEEVREGADPVTRLDAAWVDDHWLLKGADDATLATIDLTPSVKVLDGDGNPLLDAYRCGTLTKNPEATSFSVPLLKDEALYATLEWHIVDGALESIKVAGVTLKPKE